MRHLRATRAALTAAGLLCGGLAVADPAVDEALEGFDTAIETAAPASDSPAPAPRELLGWTLSGSFSGSASYNLIGHHSSSGTDYNGLSKLRLRGNLGLDRKFSDAWRATINAYAWHDAAYDLRDADYTQEVLNNYRQDANLQEAYVQGKLSERWELKLGRRVAILGYSDNLRVLDILNPLDNLEPGLADIEDLRRPVGMVQLERHAGRWRLDLALAPELRFSRNPPFGSDFYPVVDAQGHPQRFRHERPRSFDQPNLSATLTRGHLGGDLLINLAQVWHDAPYLDVSGVDQRNLARFEQDAVLRHSRVNTAGLGAQQALRSWLLKLETRYWQDLTLLEAQTRSLPQAGTITVPSGNPRHDRYDALLGVEYFGLAGTTFAVEVAGRYLPEFSEGLARAGYQRLRTETALRITRDFMNERLRGTLVLIRLDAAGNVIGARGGALYRANLDYELAQDWNLSGGLVLYESGQQPPFNVIGDNDRLFVELRRSF